MKIREVFERPGFWKGVAQSIAPQTIDQLNKQQQAYKSTKASPTVSEPKQSYYNLPSQVTTNAGIKVNRDPQTGKWFRQDTNKEVTDPIEIKRIEQLAKNAYLVAKARGIKIN